MTDRDIFIQVENKFDRITYQNDTFFWILVAPDVGIYLAALAEKIPMGNMAGMHMVLALFSLSWVYTNARRRACGIIRSCLFGLLTFLYPLIGGIVYFIFRPKQPVITELRPAQTGVWPVFGGPVWIFMRAPFRFVIKLALWLMGLAFLIISLTG